MPVTEMQPHDTSLSAPIPEDMRLYIDEARARAMHLHVIPETGIYVRAFHPREHESAFNVDIAILDAHSLLKWLNSAPGCAERTVFALLMHGRR